MKHCHFLRKAPAAVSATNRLSQLQAVTPWQLLREPVRRGAFRKHDTLHLVVT